MDNVKDNIFKNENDGNVSEAAKTNESEAEVTELQDLELENRNVSTSA